MSSDQEEDRSHSLLVIKRTPEALVQLRSRLCQPQHEDIYNEAVKAATFEEVLGTVAAMLDIAVDGYVDVDNFCTTLCTALDNRGDRRFTGQPHLTAPGLVNAEMVERSGTITLEKVEELELEDRIKRESTVDEGRYTICRGCTTSFDCIANRTCGLGKPAAQLGNALTLKTLKETIN